MRFGLASAGDGMEDANFMELTANSGVLRLYTQIQWIEVFYSLLLLVLDYLLIGY